GLGMAQTPGVSGRVFHALGKAGINVLAIAQGSSELNISMAVDSDQVDAAIRTIHQEFGLHRRDTGVDTGSDLDLLLVGYGQIGRALTDLVFQRRTEVFRRFGLKARIVALADRSGYVFEPQGIPLESLTEFMDAKASGRPLSDFKDAKGHGNPTDMVRDALGWRLAHPILVDVSDADDSHLAMMEALKSGCDVVTANKKPLAGEIVTYRRLVDEAERGGLLLKAEATVGAGLPVVDTIETLLATGDRITVAEGCLSGTLAFIMYRLEQGVRFSAAVAEAVEAGYTEPDPVTDLSGVDVGRKAVILGRMSGLVQTESPITPEPLVDESLTGLDWNALADRLKEYDEPMAARVKGAADKGCVLRYMARVTANGIEVGTTEVSSDSPFWALKGTDNMISFTSDRYADRPLVITGPGAGVEVTAMGVLGDILRIAAQRV
ncbi:MAG: ACT domain-containing protein, partial [Deltaproteobacteria bacterium]|nr:ACT domain-containing protein [Deltaproteobacteria bacterium]